MTECDYCHDEGHNDGRFCDCEAGQEYFEAERARYAWMVHYVRQANAYEREGDHESAEAIRKMVCQ